MAGLFGRIVEVQLGRANSTGVAHRGLRVAFDVEHTDSSVPSTGRVDVYNLGADTVATMQRDDAVMRLLVGYQSQGGVPRQIFQGNPTKGGVRLERRDVDRILTIEAQDGGQAFRTKHISESLHTPTTSGQVFSALSEAYGVDLGYVEDVVGTVSFPRGITLVGPVPAQLDRIAELSDAQWTVRDGALHVWRRGSTTGEPSVLFSSVTRNLVGTPTQKNGLVEVTGLLAPSLRPGKPFRVESDEINGDFVATKVRFFGDSGWATPFYTRAVGKRIAA